jgi:hypothetical protein
MRSTAPTPGYGLTWRNATPGTCWPWPAGTPFTLGLRTSRADELARRLPKSAWQRYSAGPGAKGHRYYHWAWVATDPGQPGHHWLLIRRNRHTRELAYYRCYSPRHVPLATLVKVAGLRWPVEENFAAGKGLAGLDEHQVRT